MTRRRDVALTVAVTDGETGPVADPTPVPPETLVPPGSGTLPRTGGGPPVAVVAAATGASLLLRRWSRRRRGIESTGSVVADSIGPPSLG